MKLWVSLSGWTMVMFFCHQNKTNPERRYQNEQYRIGVDCHISSLDFAVVNERGAATKKAKVNTSVKEFIYCVKGVPKLRKISIEEGELAGWLLETGLKFGERLIITDPKINQWIGKAGQLVNPLRFFISLLFATFNW